MQDSKYSLGDINSKLVATIGTEGSSRGLMLNELEHKFKEDWGLSLCLLAANLGYTNTSALLRAISKSYNGIYNDNGFIKPIVHSGNSHVFELIDRTNIAISRSKLYQSFESTKKKKPKYKSCNVSQREAYLKSLNIPPSGSSSKKKKKNGQQQQQEEEEFILFDRSAIKTPKYDLSKCYEKEPPSITIKTMTTTPSMEKFAQSAPTPFAKTSDVVPKFSWSVSKANIVKMVSTLDKEKSVKSPKSVHWDFSAPNESFFSQSNSAASCWPTSPSSSGFSTTNWKPIKESTSSTKTPFSFTFNNPTTTNNSDSFLTSPKPFSISTSNSFDLEKIKFLIWVIEGNGRSITLDGLIKAFKDEFGESLTATKLSSILGVDSKNHSLVLQAFKPKIFKCELRPNGETIVQVRPNALELLVAGGGSSENSAESKDLFKDALNQLSNILNKLNFR